MILYLYIIQNINFLLDNKIIQQKTPSPDLAIFWSAYGKYLEWC
jgi:hypothetical protein